jgi:hypothetical protein
MGHRTTHKPSEVYGRLTLLYHCGGRYWLCECECGTEGEFRIDHLVSGLTQSCGCLNKEQKTSHGHTVNGRTPTYESWRAMRDRCELASHPHYQRYGGRGIRVCEQWLGPEGFANFLRDMGERPSGKHSIDRIDNEGHYEPSNCKWSTMVQQHQNRSTNVNLTHNGKTQCLTAWSVETGIRISTLRARLQRGLSVEEVLTLSTDRWGRHEYVKASKGRVCSNCGGDREPFRKGRCNTCSTHFYKFGVERPCGTSMGCS